MRCLFAYLFSTLLWVIANPRGLWQTWRQMSGQIPALARWLRRPQPSEALLFSLPFAGRWTVLNGGVDRATSHSWGLVSQRYAYDFVITGDEGRTFGENGRSPQAYHCFGQPILAAADGQVVAVQKDIPDYAHAGSCWIDWRTPDLRGNYVIIQHDDGVYSLSAHLQQGSVIIAPGERVQQGQMIGLCGNSGHSTEPHLHFQVQDHPDFFRAVGLPIRFVHFGAQEIGGEGEKTAVAAGYVHKNHQVWPEQDPDGLLMPPVQPAFKTSDLITSVANSLFGFIGLAYVCWLLFSVLLRLLA